MILGEDLDGLVVFVLDEEQVVFDDIQQPLLGKQAFHHDLELVHAGVVVAFFPVHALPFVESVNLGSKGAHLGGDSIRDDEEGVACEKGRYVVAVPIVLGASAQLVVGVFQSGHRGILKEGFELHDDQRDAVDIDEDIRDSCVSSFLEFHLMENLEHIVFDIGEVDQFDQRVDGKLLILDGDTIHEIAMEDLVALEKRWLLDSFDDIDGLFQVIIGQFGVDSDYRLS